RQCGVERSIVADTAGQLHRDVELAHHRREQLTVAAAAERRIEVDEVHPLRALLLPAECGRQWVAVRRLRSRLALHEAYGLPVGDVDGGEKDESRHANDRSREARIAGILPA